MQQQKTVIGIALAIVVLGAHAVFAADSGARAATNAPTPAGASAGEFNVHADFRYRIEFVDQDAFARDAVASTLRSRLQVQSGTYHDFSAFTEVEDVHRVLSDNFNDGATSAASRTRYPAVIDPNGTELNQVYVQYVGLADSTLRYGRQRINLNNQRFVGGVGWRQNEQTYDALSAVSNYGGVGEFTYAYVWNVNRIWGDSVDARDHHQGGTHFVNATFDVAPSFKASTYLVYIDNDDVPALSSRTLGARLEGKLQLTEPNGLAVPLMLEYAQQHDAARNPVSYSAGYFHFNGGVEYLGWTGKIGVELLEGDRRRPGHALQTPLATLHGFNGWADKFLTTPAAGLDDRYVSLEKSYAGWTGLAAYHVFEADDGGADLGRELDVQFERRFAERYGVALKLAHFNGASAGPDDTIKAWLMVSAQW